MDCFLESQNTKDIKAVLSYLEKNDFPIDYIDHFEEQFRLEIEKSTEKNKEKSNNSKEINEDEKVEKKKEVELEV